MLYIVDCNLSLSFKVGGDVQMRMEGDEEEKVVSDKIYIVDHSFALNQFDFIENC